MSDHITEAANIAAALRAAGEAARKAFTVPGCCMEGTGCELPPCHCSQVAAAAAIAAFLRAAPDAIPLGKDMQVSLCRTSRVLLAQEVERAARGGE